MNGRTYPGIRASGRLRSIYCTLEQAEWTELHRYIALDGLSMTQLCNQLLRDYTLDCRAYYKHLSGAE